MPPKPQPPRPKKQFNKLKKKPQKKTIGINEPYRRSVLDNLQENLKIMDRAFLLSRLCIAGYHNSEIAIMKAEFKENVVKANDDITTTDKITGTLLCYKKLYCCVLEGSEDALHTFITMTFYGSSSDLFGETRLLSREPHIRDRFASDWFEYSGIPNTLLSKPDKQNSSLEDKCMILAKSMEKMYTLVSLLEKQHIEHLSKDKMSTNSAEICPVASTVTATQSKRTFSSRELVDDMYKDNLIEVEILEFLVDQPNFLISLDMMMKPYFNPFCLSVDNYQENIWPIGQDRGTYSIFDSEFEPIAELPKFIHLQQQNTEVTSEEENNEEQ